MNITTAEIKRLMMECAADGRIHNTDDYKQYIKNSSNRQCTPGQLAGALRQLSETGRLEKVERGLYKIAGVATGENSSERESVTLRQQLSSCIEETELRLERIVNGMNVWEITQEEFALITKLKELNNEMRRVVDNH